MVSAEQTQKSELPDRSLIDSKAGWLVVLATFLSTFTVFGVAYSFGAFFGPMAEEFGADRSATAFFFSITTFLYFAFGVVSGRMADRHGPRPVLIVGAVALVIGLLLTARVGSIWLGYLTYGLGVGVGVACAYVPMVATVGGWFETQRTTALGVAVSGIGVGTLTVTPLNEWLVGEYGWRRTYEILAIGAAVLLGIAAIGARRPPAAVQGESASLGEVLRGSLAFWILYASSFFVALALFVPFVFLADYVEERGIDGSPGLLVGLIGISSVLGRLSLGRLASRVPARTIYDTCFFVIGASFAIWLFAGDSYLLLAVFAVVLGVAYGGFIALSPAVTAELFGLAGLGAILGAVYTAAGLGGLIGPPVAGALIDGPGYTTTLVLSMMCGLTAFGVLRAERLLSRRWSSTPQRSS